MGTIIPTAQVVNQTRQVQVSHLAHFLSRSGYPIHFNFPFPDLVSFLPPQLWPLCLHTFQEILLLPVLSHLTATEMPPAWLPDQVLLTLPEKLWPTCFST